MKITIPFIIRDLQQQEITNTFGDAVFILTRWHSVINKK